MLLEENVGNNVETTPRDDTAPVVNDAQETKETTPTPAQPEEKEQTYTKSQVIDMMKKRVDRSHQAFYNRYKVKDLAEMDSVFGKIADYEKQIADFGVVNANLTKELAFVKNNIDPAKYEDVETFFKGLDRKIDSDSIVELLATHPEWLKQVAPVIQETPKTTITRISPERGHDIPETDDEKFKRIFKL